MNCSDLDQLGTLEVVEEESTYPPRLRKIIDLFQTLPEEERREALISYAE
jgi:hypothetical protein